MIREQKTDKSLVDTRKLADARTNGYSWKDGLLVHMDMTYLGGDCLRIVVPKGRCNTVLKLAHSSLLGGYFSIRG